MAIRGFRIKRFQVKNMIFNQNRYIVMSLQGNGILLFHFGFIILPFEWIDVASYFSANSILLFPYAFYYSMTNEGTSWGATPRLISFTHHLMEGIDLIKSLNGFVRRAFPSGDMVVLSNFVLVAKNFDLKFCS
jgi:hypothetical protein